MVVLRNKMNNSRALPKTSSWTTDDLRNAAANWTLAGDKALLDILQNIHKGLHERTEEVINKVDELNSELGNTSLSLKNVNNKFIGLNNTQFVECTVQEDDAEIIKKETDSDNKLIIDTQANTQQKDKDSIESEKREKILDCVSKSLRHLEGLCERLDISPDSDSDSDSNPEDIVQRTVLKPKDLYSDDPLPHIIGSQEWKKKWHIGLYECSSDSESENGDNRESSSRKKKDSYSSYEELFDNNDPRSNADRKNQMTLPIPRMTGNQQNKMSTTSSPTNYSTDTEDSEIAKINSDIKPDIHSTPKQKEDITNAQAPKPKVNASDFAAELAKKLGGGNLMSNPINTDKSQDGAFDRSSEGNKREGYSKSGTANQKDTRGGLFDSGFKSGTERGVPGNIFLDEPPPMDTESIHDDKDDLFGSNDDDNDSVGDGLFSSKPAKSNTRDLGLFGNAPASKYGGLFSDIPDDDDDVVETKKPVKKQQPSKGLFDDDSDEDIFTTKVQPKAVSKKDVEIKKPQTSSIKKVEKTRDLFDDDDLDSSVEIKTESKDKKPTSVAKPAPKGLFDDSDDESDLFGGNISFTNKNDTSKSIKPVQTSSAKPSTVEESKGTSKKKIGLFDDGSDDDGDLFSSLKPAVKSVPAKPEEKKPVIKPAIDVPKPAPPIVEKEQEDVTEEDLFSPLRMPEKKLNVQVPNISDKKVTEESQDVAVKTETSPKKPAGAVSMFGDNINILKGPNSLAASILSRKRKESSSDESTGEDFDQPPKQDIKYAKPQSDAIREKIFETVHKTVRTSDKDVLKKPTIESQKTDFSKPLETPKAEVVKGIMKQPTEVSQNKSVLDIKTSTDNNKPSNTQPVKLNKEKKDLFEGTDDLFSRNMKPSNLFDEPLDLPPPLETVKQVVKEPKNANSLFDDDEDDDDLFSSLKGSSRKSDTTKYNTNLFDDVPKEDIFRKNSSNSNVGLFSDEPPDLDYIPEDTDQEYQQNDIEEPTSSTVETPIKNSDFKITHDNAETKPKQNVGSQPTDKKKTSLFGESSDDDEDLFSSLLKKKTDNKETSIPDAKGSESNSAIVPQVTKPLVPQSKPQMSGESISDIVPQATKPVVPQSKPQILAKPDAVIEKKSDQSSIDIVEKHAVSEPPIPDTSRSENLDSKNSDVTNIVSEETNAVSSNSSRKDVKTNVDIKQLIGKLENNEIEDTKSDIQKEPLVREAKLETDIVKEEIDGRTFSLLPPAKENDKKPPESPAKTINKLKTNLNINVKALMPGSTPKLRKKTENEPQSTPTQLSPQEPTSFDSQPNSLDGVLVNNWSKDKIKVQVKRRPQSRRARHEAARKSAADMLYSFDSTDSSQYISSLPNSPSQEDVSESFSSLNSEVISSVENSISEQFESIIETIGKVYGSSPKNNEEPSKISLDDESSQSHGDIFNIRSTVPTKREVNTKVKDSNKHSEIVKEIHKKKETNVKKAEKAKPLFDDLEDDIFSAPKLGKQKSVFGDDDEDDDLFGNIPEKSIPKAKKQIEEPLKTEHGAVKKRGTKKVISKSVFNDSDSDSDLFSAKPKKIETRTEEAEKVKSGLSLFGDSDTEDDLFANISKKPIDSTKQQPHKSLFGDDEDVDIFQTTNRATKQSVSGTQNVTKTKKSTNTIQKTSTQVTTIDPLSSFLNDP